MVPMGQDVAWLVDEFGRLLLVFMFLGASVQLGPKGFIGIATYFEFPLPQLMGIFAWLFTGIGSILVLVGPLMGQAMVSILGLWLLIIFLAIATYVGHYRALSYTEGQAKSGHELSLAKNLSIVGGMM